MGKIDETNTGDCFYNNLINSTCLDKVSSKILSGKVIKLSPSEYYDEVVNRCFGGSKIARKQIMETRSSNTEKLENLKSLFLNGVELHMPYIDYITKRQEGLHRMMVIGNLYGWDYKVPVLIINNIQELDLLSGS